MNFFFTISISKCAEGIYLFSSCYSKRKILSYEKIQFKFKGTTQGSEIHFEPSDIPERKKSILLIDRNPSECSSFSSQQSRKGERQAVYPLKSSETPKDADRPWSGGSIGWSLRLCSKRLQVWFLVSVGCGFNPRWEYKGGNRCFSLSSFLSL